MLWNFHLCMWPICFWGSSRCAAPGGPDWILTWCMFLMMKWSSNDLFAAASLLYLKCHASLSRASKRMCVFRPQLCGALINDAYMWLFTWYKSARRTFQNVVSPAFVACVYLMNIFPWPALVIGGSAVTAPPSSSHISSHVQRVCKHTAC